MKPEEEIKLLRKQLNEYATVIAKQQKHMNTLHDIGTALSAENNLEKLLEMILDEARRFTNADGGTLYLVNGQESALDFKVVQTSSLDIFMGGEHGAITWPELPLYKEDGTENYDNVAAYCALKSEVVNIKNVYEDAAFNFDGPKRFDAANNYLTRSMLVIPMKNYEDEVIGVCQLINATDPNTKALIPFSEEFERSTLSLASQAAVAITNVQLINDLRELLESFIKSIASAIDAKSPYTGGHVRKVAEIAMLIANEINTVDHGIFKDKKYNFDELNQIRIAALMHDVGKITTPEYVMDKSTKLETIYDRIETIETRFELYKRDLRIDFLEAQLASDADKTRLDQGYQEAVAMIDDGMEFIRECNIGGEFMSDDKIERIKSLASLTWTDKGVVKPLLSAEEVDNLCIRKGTLTEEERQKINFHATMSVRMLEALPFPKKLAKVPEIAGGHHEKLNGKGYPKGIDGSQLSTEARLMAIADIFEALTASDRPYKDAKKMSEVMKILGFMVKDGDIDGDLLQFFYDQNLHIRYAQTELKPEQLDI